jgi:AraC-like DNA-binding protein
VFRLPSSNKRSRFASALGPALWRRTADSYVRDCIEKEATPSVKDLAVQLCLSPSQLSRAFIASTGMALSSVFTRTRLDEAKRLLVESDLPVAVLAYRCGFQNLRTFERFFKRVTSQTPGEYRASARNVGRLESVPSA